MIHPVLITDISRFVIDIIDTLSYLFHAYALYLRHPTFCGIIMSTGQEWAIRIVTFVFIVLIAAIVIAMLFFIGINYKERWCTLSLKVTVVSVEFQYPEDV